MTLVCIVVVQFRLCSVVFEGADPTSHSDAREAKRATLQEIVAFHAVEPKLFSHFRVLEDAVTMVG
jgi:hypothetical protein